MKSYSTDLRHKIVQAYTRRLGSQRALAELFGVSVSFVAKLLRRPRRTPGHQNRTQEATRDGWRPLQRG